MSNEVVTSQRSEATMLSQIADLVVERVSRKDVPLPSLPRVALRVFALLKEQDFGVAQVAAIIESDPMVTARLVRLANSPVFARFGRAETVSACITRLGLRELTYFLMETASRQLLEGNDPRIRRICEGLWKHSLSVAVLAHDIAAQLPDTDSPGAYLAGLLHDVGRPVIAGMLLDAERRLVGTRTDRWLAPAQWLNVVVECERDVGLAVCRACHLPEAVAHAVSDCSHYDPTRPRSLANLVRLADALSAIHGTDPIAPQVEEMFTRAKEGCGVVGMPFKTAVALTVRLPERLAAKLDE
jgi:putative nucleotidyltransferase with HDIG domain